MTGPQHPLVVDEHTELLVHRDPSSPPLIAIPPLHDEVTSRDVPLWCDVASWCDRTAVVDVAPRPVPDGGAAVIGEFVERGEYVVILR